jgi:Family of unknown function (DUF6153)
VSGHCLDSGSMSGTQPRVNAATALRRVCGVAALLGLFAMHGLAVHGAMHAGHDADPMPAAVAATHDHSADHGADQVALPDTRDESPSGGSRERTPDHGLVGFAGLCLAILLAGMAAVVFLSRYIRLRRGRDPLAAQGWPARSRRDRDPPCLLALSIQRC